jgi:hypothetical protein
MPASGIKSRVDTAGAYGLFVLTTDKLNLSYRQLINQRRPFAGMYFKPFYFDIKFGGFKSQLTVPRPDR